MSEKTAIDWQAADRWLMGAAALMSFEGYYWLTHVYESGARVQTELTRMSSRVDGALDQDS